MNFSDTFETRIFLMLIHFSIILINFKIKNEKFDQKIYDDLFHSIENNLREMGFGDVTVNKKMKDINKILYDIILKINLNQSDKKFVLNRKVIIKYFELSDQNKEKLDYFDDYISNFFNFCFDKDRHNMIKDLKNYNYGSS